MLYLGHAQFRSHQIVEARPRNVVIYIEPKNKAPFDEWMNRLKDVRGKAQIETRINKLRRGIVGDHRDAGEGIIELRIHVGPGYRVYGVDDGTSVLILCAGTKATQARDIARAKRYWKKYNC